MKICALEILALDFPFCAISFRTPRLNERFLGNNN